LRVRVVKKSAIAFIFKKRQHGILSLVLQNAKWTQDEEVNISKGITSNTSWERLVELVNINCGRLTRNSRFISKTAPSYHTKYRPNTLK